MTRLYKKNELTFALFSIFIYVLLFSTADIISEKLGILKSVTVAVGFSLSAVFFLWIRKNGLNEKYGLCIPSYNKLITFDLFLMIFLSSSNLWGGISIRYNTTETVLYILSMASVGFVEEVIFRGFLFKALYKDNKKAAVIVSSVTFGIGHIVNLLNGADLVPTIVQILHAALIGYIFTLIFIRTKSILLCIVIHSLINMLDVFSSDVIKQGIPLLLLTSVLVIYAFAYSRTLSRYLK